MALQTEIWIRSIVEGLWPDNSFVSKAANDDQYVNNKKVHIPNSGSPSGVVIDRSSLPASVQKRTDQEVEYSLHEFTTNPVVIQLTEEMQLSYSKRESVIKEDRAHLIEEVAEYLLKQWSPAAAHRILTSGSAVAAHAASATGTRKAITTADVFSLMTKFNQENIPQENRYLLLDAVMYAQLMDSMTQNQMAAYALTADLKKGIMGQFGSFNIMLRSTALRYSADGTTVKTGLDAGAATDVAAGLAWHENSVSRSKGDVKMFANEADAAYYGDVFSFLVNAGGAKRRYDGKGVWAIVQDTPADPQGQNEDGGEPLA